MRVDTLHRKIAADAVALHAAVDDIFPVQLPTRYAETPTSIKTFIRRLNRVTEPLGVFNEMKSDKEVSPGLVFNTGLWLGKDELPENESNADIRIMWHLHPTTKRVLLTQSEWNRRRYYFWSMLLHELIHRYQDTYRTPTVDIRVYRPRTTQRDTKEEQAYYGNYDEIEAHSHDAAVELMLWWPHLTFREAVREALTYSGRIVTPTYQTYQRVFTWDSTVRHPALIHFKRKVKTWYALVKVDRALYDTLKMTNLVN